MELKKFSEPIGTSKEALADALTGEKLPEAEPVVGPHGTIKLDGLVALVKDLDPSIDGTQLDSALIEAVRESLPLNRRLASQPEVWHWLTIVGFDRLVWRRWVGEPFPGSVEELRAFILEDPSPASLPGRYLGRAGIVSLGRNTLARLWWAAECLGRDYDLARKAVGNAQLSVDLFERRLGLNRKTAVACTQVLSNSSDSVVKSTVRRLQQRAKTTLLEELEEEELVKLIEGLASEA